MAIEHIREKLSKLTSGEPSKWMEDAKWRKDNKAWLKKSQAIALKVLRTLRGKKLQQKELAQRLGVSDQQISKMLKGKENLTLDTISKLEQALGIVLMEIPNDSKSQEIILTKKQFDYEYKSSKVLAVRKTRPYRKGVLAGQFLRSKIVTVAEQNKINMHASTMVYTPKRNNKYKEAA